MKKTTLKSCSCSSQNYRQGRGFLQEQAEQRVLNPSAREPSPWGRFTKAPGAFQKAEDCALLVGTRHCSPLVAGDDICGDRPPSVPRGHRPPSPTAQLRQRPRGSNPQPPALGCGLSPGPSPLSNPPPARARRITSGAARGRRRKSLHRSWWGAVSEGVRRRHGGGERCGVPGRAAPRVLPASALRCPGQDWRALPGADRACEGAGLGWAGRRGRPCASRRAPHPRPSLPPW